MINTLKDIFYALTSPEKYREFMNYKTKKLVLYAFLLTFLSGLIAQGIPFARLMAAGGFEVLLEEGIPDFRASSEDGLWIEEPIEVDEYNLLINANSDIVRDDISDLNGQYGSYDFVIMADKEQIYVKAAGMQEVTARYDEMPGFSFSKSDIIEYVPMMYVAVIWVFVIAWLVDFGYYYLLAVIISWMAGMIASFMKVRLGNKKLLGMAIYAGTATHLLSLIQTVLGKYVPNFTLFGYIITLGYMYFAIKEYKESGYEELPPEQFGGREDKF